MSVTISEFVETTLIEICTGVERARKIASVPIAPAVFTRVVKDAKHQSVDFELKIEVVEETERKRDSGVSGKLAVVGARLGSEVSSAVTELNVQTVRFSIPVYFDHTEQAKG